MIARLTFFSTHPKDAEDLKKIYNEEVLPVIRRQKGNMGAWLLEPTVPSEDYISLTEWISKADADQYESSGTYKEMVNKARHRIQGNPVLKTYTAAETKFVATA
jgi:heme-degrading monooxygenase HmoA